MLTRRAVTSGLVAALSLRPQTARADTRRRQTTKMLRGVNLAGADFGQLIPGQYGRDYIYPGTEDFALVRAQGFNVVRLPFKWERLQPDLGQPFDATEWGYLRDAIRHAKRARLSLILDPHNYAHRRVRADDFTVEHIIGSEHVPADSFIAFWRELAARTRKNDHLIYGLMNEPYDLAAEAWLPMANDAIAAVRNAGARALILVPGVAYTGAHSWHASGNTQLAGIRDPQNHVAIEVHQYLDGDSSGKTRDIVSETIGVERIAAFEAWAREHKFKAFLGEFGAGADQRGLAALSNLVRALERAPDVWIGWTAWAAGPWWGDDEPFRLSPSKSGTVPAQTELLSRFARGQM